MTRRTIRRLAHELYPHADEWEVRPLSVEVPYLYARVAGFDVSDTGWSDALRRERGDRIMILNYAIHSALLADALHQGMGGDEAWAYANRDGQTAYEIAFERAVHHGVPVRRIKPYPCGPEPDRHGHMESTGDVTGHGLITVVNGPESECPTCTESTEDPS